MASPAVTSDGLLFINSLDGFFHCLDVNTGKSHWKYDLLTEIWASPVLYRNHLLLGSTDGELYVFDASSKSNEPAHFFTDNFSSIYATVHIDGDYIYVTSRDRLTKLNFSQK